MFTYHLKSAFRHLRRRKGYAALNVSGLALGLACSILLVLYVRSERAVDATIPDRDRIQRVGSYWQEESMGLPITAPAPVGPALARTYPEVEAQTRLWAGWINLRTPGAPALRRNGYVADPNVASFFGLPMLHGNARTALDRPRSILLHEGLARALFGTTDAVGRTVTLETYNTGDQTYTVTGVWRDLPFNSFTHFGGEPYDLIVPWTGADDFVPAASWADWTNRTLLTYVKLAPGASTERLTAAFDGFVRREAPAELHGAYRPILEPLARLYLDDEDGKNRRTVGLLAGLAALILLVACINFANLATARALERAREIGVRKAIGARRGHLVSALLGEAFLVSTLATVLGAGLARVLQGPFFSLTGKPLVLDHP
ncbi:MAG TPA: ABC transporter permease, partial [Rhodothermales bacterium]|nr:ABC transporter permease [Rhodothermales bacterium]